MMRDIFLNQLIDVACLRHAVTVGGIIFLPSLNPYGIQSAVLDVPRGCLERLLSLRAKRSKDPQSPEKQLSVFHEMASQARHDRLLRQLHKL